MRKVAVVVGIVSVAAFATSAMASELVYTPTNPSLGGDALNGNWLLSQAQAQTKDGGGSSDSPGFSIDFPDFGGINQPAPTPIILPSVPPAN